MGVLANPTTLPLEVGSPVARALYQLVAGDAWRVNLHTFPRVYHSSNLDPWYEEMARIAVHAAKAADPFPVTISSPFTNGHLGIARALARIAPDVPIVFRGDGKVIIRAHEGLAHHEYDPWGLDVALRTALDPAIYVQLTHGPNEPFPHPGGVPLWLVLAGAGDDS